MKTRHIIQVLLFFFILLFPFAMQAQPGFGDDTPDAGAPIDGGLSILLAAGVGYGVKKVYQKRKGQRQMTGLEE